MRRYIWLSVLALSGFPAGCTDDLPTGASEGLVPNVPRSVEVLLPFEAFAEEVSVFGGYGRATQLGKALVATEFQGSLDAYTLVRFGGYPTSVTVEDEEGTQQTDTNFTIIGADLVIRADTLLNPGSPVTLTAGKLTTPWSPATATWTMAVDSLGGEVPWPEPGAGPVDPLDSTVWDPSVTDSVTISVDSTTVAEWGDIGNGARGARVGVEEAGVRLGIRDFRLRLEIRPSVPSAEPTIFVPAQTRLFSVIYSPEPDPPPDGLRVGGAPSWRSVLEFRLPESLDGPSELCDLLGCPFTLRPGNLTYAGLALTTRAVPPAYVTPDSLSIDARPVLQAERLERSPLGQSLVPGIVRVAPAAAAGGGEVVDIPLTPHIRDLVRGETASGGVVRPHVALLTAAEPAGFMFTEFDGPGGAAPPVLRLILTEAGEVTLP